MNKFVSWLFWIAASIVLGICYGAIVWHFDQYM